MAFWGSGVGTLGSVSDDVCSARKAQSDERDVRHLLLSRLANYPDFAVSDPVYPCVGRFRVVSFSG
jgi:hypothetical protein